MIARLLPAQHIRSLLDDLMSSRAGAQAALILLDLSDWLQGTRRDPGVELSASDEDLLREVLDVLSNLDEILEQRMARPPCLYSDRSSFVYSSFIPPWRLAAPLHTWKPENALWTSPSTGDGQSAWSLRSTMYGDALRHAYNLVFPCVAAEQRKVLNDLKQADLLLERHGGSIQASLIALHEHGFINVDFTWRLVLEAEIEVLRGMRSPGAFPSGLGVECSLWLSSPPEPALAVPLGSGEESALSSHWFAYE